MSIYASEEDYIKASAEDFESDLEKVDIDMYFDMAEMCSVITSKAFFHLAFYRTMYEYNYEYQSGLLFENSDQNLF